MIVEIDLEVSDLVEQIESLGGTIKWQRTVPEPERPVWISDVQLDDDYVVSRLPRDRLEPDDNPRDVRDFVAACLAGDRATAEALLPRVFGSAAGQIAAEQVLRPVRRVA